MKRFPTLAREGKEDLLQECLTHWYFKRNQYDPLKPAAYKTYMSRVIENKLRDLMDHKERQKRKTMYQSISIDELIGDIEDDSYCEQLAVDDESFKEMDKADFSDLLLKALEKLSGRQQELCRLIKDEGLNLDQISKKLNLPRATVYDEIIRIREFFKREGLNDYLT